VGDHAAFLAVVEPALVAECDVALAEIGFARIAPLVWRRSVSDADQAIDLSAWLPDDNRRGGSSFVAWARTHVRTVHRHLSQLLQARDASLDTAFAFSRPLGMGDALDESLAWGNGVDDPQPICRAVVRDVIERAVPELLDVVVDAAAVAALSEAVPPRLDRGDMFTVTIAAAYDLLGDRAAAHRLLVAAFQNKRPRREYAAVLRAFDLDPQLDRITPDWAGSDG
jgi:hypothetical protein